MMSEWQPIETAPKDGTLVLTWGDARACFAVSYWCPSDEEWMTDFRGKGNEQIVYATHWMPLPAPPASPLQASGTAPTAPTDSEVPADE